MRREEVRKRKLEVTNGKGNGRVYERERKAKRLGNKGRQENMRG